VNSAPEISGYELDLQLLDHPLAEIWRGRSFTGMEVVVLVLSAAGADDPAVRDRLSQASRTAALGPERDELPLWAANLTATRPYAVTQLVPGQSGAERLIDPLDGLIGNDEYALAAVRQQLTPYGAAPIPAAAVEQFPSAQAEPSTGAVQADQAPKSKKWPYVVAVVVVLAVFSITYSVGAAIKSATSDVEPVVPPPAAVSPAALPVGVLSPGIAKPLSSSRYKPGSYAGLVGAIYSGNDVVYPASGLGLPFEFGLSRPRLVDETRSGESSSTIYRRVLTRSDPALSEVDLRIALRPCQDRAACLAGRAAFDKDWTTAFKAAAPTTPRGDRTWYAAGGTPYTVSLSHVFKESGRYWLLGAAAVALPGEEASAQRVVNDIWIQTPTG
jgi:hypothetical protein